MFAPTDDAFGKLPDGTVTTLTQPENKDKLTKILTYHVVAGRISSKQLAKMIKKDNGTATLTTVEGGTLKAMMSGSNITLTDEKGGTATITTADVFQKNGVIHVIDTVLMPNNSPQTSSKRVPNSGTLSASNEAKHQARSKPREGETGSPRPIPSKKIVRDSLCTSRVLQLSPLAKQIVVHRRSLHHAWVFRMVFCKPLDGVIQVKEQCPLRIVANHALYPEET